MIEIIETELSQIEESRELYFSSLPECQECFMEMLVNEGKYYIISINSQKAGYAIASIDKFIAKTQDKILIEFYLHDRFIPQSEEVFSKILKELSINKIYCKSYDALLLSSCFLKSMPYKVFGRLFRLSDSSTKYHIPLLYKHRLAEIDDYDFLLSQGDELYDTPEELKDLIKQKTITLFYHNDELVGCGYKIPLNSKKEIFDIGMWTNPKYRGKGIATYIISFLKYECIENGKTPICACAKDNTYSMKTLQKNGFISKYNLIEFENNL
ncbi:MAG: GNAT family N-acetyltransferase [Bacteroidales bacterium]|jgi:GNAT superfamily N-acetyltransferase|nr:GNAT family N-acetyltransferase [Bacteroidales bacterium]MDD4703035.1 GNAT family N-acetyltransferase [Bacteroidales bacterium]MDX9797363.1 GNAT family N-acetyltransferase [Bacteroidales bacterium]